MKFSCLPVSLYQDITDGRRSLGEWFQLAADLGLDGADMSVAHLTSLDTGYLDDLRSQAEDAGVVIACMVTYTDFTQPNADERARQVESLRRYIDAASRLSVSFLRVTAGQGRPGVARDDGIAWAVEGLTACLDLAASAGVTLMYENHTIGYGWTQFDFSLPADIYLEIVRRTEGSGLKLLFDTANNLAENDNPVALLEQVKHRLAVLHVSDIEKAGAFQPVVIGTGVSPLPDIFAILHRMGFDSWISVEEASRTGEDGLQKGISHTRALWDKVTSVAG